MTRARGLARTAPSVMAGALLVASVARADGDAAGEPGELRKAADGFAASAESTTKAEIIKRELGLLVQNARLSDPSTAEEAAQEIAEAISSMEMDARATQAFFDRMKKMDKAQLSRLVRQKGNGVLAYGRAILAGEGGDIAAVKALLASGGDGAGLEAVRLLRRLEAGLPVDPEDFKRVVGSLPPKKASSLIDAVRGEFKAGDSLKKQFYDSVGTMVDGVFVFNDAVNIYYSDDPPEEKAAAASGKGVEFAAGTVGGIAAGALGGGFGAGIVIGWSATQVGDLTREMIGLYHDRQNAALKEEWAKLELREMTIKKMLEVDRLIKAGKLDQALEQSKRLREFYEEREQLIGDPVLGSHLVALRNHLGEASRKQSALLHLAEARRPYERALASHGKGMNLSAARADAREARRILERWLSTCPDLAEPLAQARQLEAAINDAIAKASPVRVVSAEAPKSVALGEWAELRLNASGGVPWYSGGPGSTPGSTFAIAYWKATGEPGARMLLLRLEDDIGQTATREVTIEVVAGAADADAPVAAPPGSGRSPAAVPVSPPSVAADPVCQRAKQCCWNNVRRTKAASDGGACSSFRNRQHCEMYIARGGCG